MPRLEQGTLNCYARSLATRPPPSPPWQIDYFKYKKMQSISLLFLIVIYLSFTCVVLSPYLYLSSRSFHSCKFLAVITFQFIHGKHLYFSRESCTFLCCSSKFFFAILLKYLAVPFLLNIRFFLSVFSRLFINLYIVISVCVCVCVCVCGCMNTHALHHVKSNCKR